MYTQPKETQLPYQNPDLPIEQRVEDLLARMTLEEKVAQLGSRLPFVEAEWRQWIQSPLEDRIAQSQAQPFDQIAASGVGQLSLLLRELPPRLAAEVTNTVHSSVRQHSRLGIPPIIHDEGLHGVLANDATSFPQSIGMASSWDPVLLEQVATAIGWEARTRGIRQLLSPTINVARDPRCGRTEETYGEDPYLASRMAVAFVKGVQSQGVVTTPKHFAANFVGDGGRDSNPIHFSERLLREIYLPAFEAAVREGGALSLMAAYNSLDGIPCSCHHWLLTDLLRGEWGFQGFVVSDYGSVGHIHEYHRVAATRMEAGQRALEAGLEVELPVTDCFGPSFVEGVRQGRVSEEALDEAVRRILWVKFWLGLFDDPFTDPDLAERVNHAEHHQALALETAREAIVLLKNEYHALPLAANVQTLAVLGPLADTCILGNYTWDGYPPERYVTLLRGIRSCAQGVDVRFAQGCEIKGESKEGFAEAVRLASQSQVAVVCAGNSPLTEGEGRDRADLALPGVQADLIKAVAATGVPTIVVLVGGSAVVMAGWIEQVAAVVEAWYPGEQGGTAVAEVLFGDTNPSGKLPITFPRAVGQLPLYYNHKPTGRGYDYVDLTGQPLFPFGHGMSYTTFEYRNLRVTPHKVGSHGQVTIGLEVQNTGERAGDEVVQLYIHDPVASLARPVKELKGFRRVRLQPGETQAVTFELDVQRLGFLDAHMQHVVEPGAFEVMVGSSSADIRLSGGLEVV